jgi:sec-independent protein translocase protein TatA
MIFLRLMPTTATPSLFALFDVGGGEMILILVVVLLLFGGKRMPELARGLGKSINEFKKATSGVEAQIKQAMEDARETATAAMNAPEKKTIPLPPANPVSTPPSAASPDTPQPPPTDGKTS